jgi:hypothetical protein
MKKLIWKNVSIALHHDRLLFGSHYFNPQKLHGPEALHFSYANNPLTSSTSDSVNTPAAALSLNP